MVLVEYLNSGCYSQLHLIESRLKAMKCGFMEGIYWSIIICIVISIISFRMIIGIKKIDVEPNLIKNYAIIIMVIVSVLVTSFFTIGYTNKWNSYQNLIVMYRKQGLSDYEINYLLQLEQSKSSAPYVSAIASSGLLFLGKKETKETKETNISDDNLKSEIKSLH
jgi:hypothetical protein